MYIKRSLFIVIDHYELYNTTNSNTITSSNNTNNTHNTNILQRFVQCIKLVKLDMNRISLLLAQLPPECKFDDAGDSTANNTNSTRATNSGNTNSIPFASSSDSNYAAYMAALTNATSIGKGGVTLTLNPTSSSSTVVFGTTTPAICTTATTTTPATTTATCNSIRTTAWSEFNLALSQSMSPSAFLSQLASGNHLTNLLTSFEPQDKLDSYIKRLYTIVKEEDTATYTLLLSFTELFLTQPLHKLFAILSILTRVQCKSPALQQVRYISLHICLCIIRLKCLSIYYIMYYIFFPYIVVNSTYYILYTILYYATTL